MRRSSKRAVVLGAVVLGAVVLASACGSESLTEKAIEEATGVQVDEDGNVVSISTDEGSIRVDSSGNVEVVTSDGSQVLSSGQEGELPDDFPDDVPVPDAAITSSLASDSDGVRSWIVNLETEDTRGTYDEYVATLNDAGFTVDDIVAATAGGVFSALSSADNGTWTVGIMAADGSGLTITVTAAS